MQPKISNGYVEDEIFSTFPPALNASFLRILDGEDVGNPKMETD